MKKIILFVPFILWCFFGFAQQEITGDWYGQLNVQGMQLQLIFHIAHGENGYTTTMDSPDQGANGIPVSETNFANDSLHLNLTALNAAYKGRLQDSLSISGKFSQNGLNFPLNLSRKQKSKTAKAEAPKRPQEPKEPFPYVSEEVKFDNKKAKVSLAGTLTLPRKTGTFPAVILISGSGPQNRNEELMGHKPFLVIADYLTRNGIAVLRYDDRGVGESTGKFKGATTYDFAADAKAAIAYLKSRSEIDPDKIGLIGHSEGGMIAPLIASEDKSIDFVVLLAAPGLPIDKMMLLQKKGIEKKMGVPEAQINAGQKMNSELFALVKSSKSGAVQTNLESYLTTHGIADDASRTQILQTFEDPWMQTFLKYDPQPVLEKIDCPVLALNGSKDLQVPATENLEAIRTAFSKSGNKNVTIKELPGLNHLFQHADTGLPSEYAEIEETFSPQTLQLIKGWILGAVK